ncbi:peptide ABC transporter substrate-binding protein [Phytoactinopolyspora mesophila]|uniref:ABC transporter substrate-binding protein n=1 Tax=Phytoactinopolyspora mesophila TaxID=2650750 RepID=A0A7K3M912_9ACTN|nr:ABC transporter substrate-binding protein [Phytoactinopolyspora mesophila]NDL59774.1 ABC transporter substrate-binding protein [Phytoactinopolyspora mesophila]
MGWSARGAVLGVGIVILSACGADSDPAGDGSSSVSVRGCNPQSPLVPAWTAESCGGQVVDQLFSKLVRYHPETAEPVNEIAASIESDDNQTWVVTLEEGWTFHNGEAITAHSFVDAWNWAAYAPNGAVNSRFFQAIEGYDELQPSDLDEDEFSGGEITPDMVREEEMSGLQVDDDMKFTVTLSQPESSFPLRLGYVAYAPLPEEFFADPEAYGDAPVGSGPFQFAEWVPGAEIRLEAYPGYQGAGRPQIDEVIFRIYQDDTAAYGDLQADNLDIMPHLPSSALADDAYRSDLGDRFVEREALVVSKVTFAPESVDPALADPRLRQAISMAIDRDAIIDNIFHGTREPATGWVSPGVEGYEPDVCGEYCTFQPDRARELLEEAGGYSDTLTLTYNADGENRPWVDATCNSIHNTLGIECVGVPVADFGTFRTKIQAREIGGIFRNVWQADYPSIESFLGPVYSTGAPSNDGDFSDPEFDELIGEAASMQGDDAIDRYNAAESLLSSGMPSIPLWYASTVAGYSTRVDHVEITPFQSVDLLNVTLR